MVCLKTVFPYGFYLNLTELVPLANIAQLKEKKKKKHYLHLVIAHITLSLFFSFISDMKTLAFINDSLYIILFVN